MSADTVQKFEFEIQKVLNVYEKNESATTDNVRLEQTTMASATGMTTYQENHPAILVDFRNTDIGTPSANPFSTYLTLARLDSDCKEDQRTKYGYNCRLLFVSVPETVRIYPDNFLHKFSTYVEEVTYNETISTDNTLPENRPNCGKHYDAVRAIIGFDTNHHPNQPYDHPVYEFWHEAPFPTAPSRVCTHPWNTQQPSF